MGKKINWVGVCTLIYIFLIVMCFIYKSKNDCDKTYQMTGICHTPENGKFLKLSFEKTTYYADFLVLITKHTSIPYFLECKIQLPNSIQIQNLEIFFNSNDSYIDVYHADDECYLNAQPPKLIYYSLCWHIMFFSTIIMILIVYVTRDKFVEEINILLPKNKLIESYSNIFNSQINSQINSKNNSKNNSKVDSNTYNTGLYQYNDSVVTIFENSEYDSKYYNRDEYNI